MQLKEIFADAIEDGIGSALARAIRGAAPPLFAASAVKLNLWSDWDYTKAVSEAFRSNEIVFRCMRIRANALCSIPIRARRALPDGNTGDLPLRHPAVQFARRPNPVMGMPDIIRRVSYALDLKGRAICMINSVDARNGAIELWPLRPDLTQIKVASSTEIAVKYSPGSGAGDQTYSQDQILLVTQYDPLDEYNGIATIRPAGRRIDTANSIQTAQKYAFDNAVLPSGLISGDMSEKQAQAIKDQIEKTKAGPKNFRKVIIARTRAYFESFMGKAVEMDFSDSGTSADRKIAVSMGIHPVLLGIVDATFDNQNMAEIFLWTNETVPAIAMIVSALNAQVAPKFGDDVVFEPDLSKSPPLVENSRQNAKISQYYMQLGINIRAINERLQLGFAPTACPDSGFMQAGMLPLENSRSARVTRDSFRALNLPDDAIDTRWKRVDSLKRAYEEAMARNVKARFLEESDRVTSAYAGGVSNVEALIDSEAAAWRPVIQASWYAVIERFGRETASEIAGEVERASKRFDPFAGAIRAYVEAQVAETMDAITVATKAAVKRTVEAGMLEGASAKIIAGELKGLYRRWAEGDDTDGLSFDQSRAYKIARTEVHSASGYASREAAIQSAVVAKKRWVTSRDGNVRDLHIEMEGERAGLNETYSNGLMFPGDQSGAPDEVIQCRCQEVYETRSTGGEGE